jgi:hypothetical protein
MIKQVIDGQAYIALSTDIAAHPAFAQKRGFAATGCAFPAFGDQPSRANQILMNIAAVFRPTIFHPVKLGRARA